MKRPVRSILNLFLVFVASGSLFAQGDKHELLERHALIDELYFAEKHAQLISAVDRQLAAAEGTVWQDSIFLYTYKYGRAHWKVNGAQAGVDAAQSVVDRLDKDKTNELINAMGKLSLLQYEVGQMRECTRVDSMALVIADASPETSDLTRGSLRHYLGFDHSILGDYDKAAKYFMEAVVVFERVDPPPRMNLAEACNGVGSSYWHLGRNAEAEEWYLKSLDWLGDDEAVEMVSRKASAVGNLALLWEDAGNIVKAKAYTQKNLVYNGQVIEQAIDPKVRDEAISNRANTYANLAALYFSTGEIGNARKLLELALADRNKVHEPGSIKILVLMDRFAELEMAAGNYEESEKLQQEYLDGCLAYLNTDGDYVVEAYVSMATIHLAQEKLELADSLLTKAITIQEAKNLEGGSPQLALAFLERARVRMQKGEYNLATEDLERSKALYAENHGPETMHVAICHLLLAECAMGNGNAEAAKPHIEAALGILEEPHGNDELPRSTAAPHLLPNAIHQNVLIDLATENIDREVALEELARAIKLLDRGKAAIYDQESKLLLMGAQNKIFDFAQRLAFEQYELEKSAQEVGRLLNLSEENKSILLKDRLGDFSSMSFAGVPDSLIEREQQLVSQLSVDPEDRESAGDLIQNEAEFQALLQKLQADHPEYFQLKYGQTSIDLEEVQRELLQEGQSIVAYSFTDEFLYTILIEQNKTAMLRSESAGIPAKVFAMNDAMVQRNTDNYLSLAHELYMLVFAPIEKELSNAEVLIIPDEELYYLNFETLLSASSSEDNFKDKLLIKDYTISYLLSASTALQFKSLGRSATNGALALAPGFSDEMKEAYLAALVDSAEQDTEFLQHLQQPFAVQTAQGLGKQFSSKVMVGGDAHEAAFKEHAEKHGIIHLGTHAEMNNTSPLYSKLVLSKAADQDGYLHAYEIYELELKAELAVLTACETGIGKQNRSEGVRSLAHSFAYAGCPSLVMSLWKIDEKTSSEIITSFYGNLSDGQAKNHALRKAKLDFLETASAEEALPFYWAGMVLVGDTAPLSETGSANSPWTMVLLGIVVAFLLFWFVRKRKG